MSSKIFLQRAWIMFNMIEACIASTQNQGPGYAVLNIRRVWEGYQSDILCPRLAAGKPAHGPLFENESTCP